MQQEQQGCELPVHCVHEWGGSIFTRPHRLRTHPEAGSDHRQQCCAASASLPLLLPRQLLQQCPAGCLVERSGLEGAKPLAPWTPNNLLMF
jgi:hypothetical protein